MFYVQICSNGILGLYSLEGWSLEVLLLIRNRLAVAMLAFPGVLWSPHPALRGTPVPQPPDMNAGGKGSAWLKFGLVFMKLGHLV